MNGCYSRMLESVRFLQVIINYAIGWDVFVYIQGLISGKLWSQIKSSYQATRQIIPIPLLALIIISFI